LKEMGQHPKAWLSKQRQQQANEMIQAGSSIKETAGRLDYKHPSHLTNGFKKQCGHCPTKKIGSNQGANFMNVAYLQLLSHFCR
jgi:AraC-like DNA-binding protein